MSKQPHLVSFFLARARTLGLDVETMLQCDRGALEEPFLGDDCLGPGDVDDFLRMGCLAAELKAHVERCSDCAALLNAVRPTAERDEEIVEEVAAIARRFPVELAEGHHRPAEALAGRLTSVETVAIALDIANAITQTPLVRLMPRRLRSLLGFERQMAAKYFELYTRAAGSLAFALEASQDHEERREIEDLIELLTRRCATDVVAEVREVSKARKFRLAL